MTPKEFLDQVVTPNVSDFQNDFGNVRLAFNAVAAIDALAANLFNWIKSNATGKERGATNDSAYRAALSKIDVDFPLVRDLAKANKHFLLTDGKPKVSSAD